MEVLTERTNRLVLDDDNDDDYDYAVDDEEENTEEEARVSLKKKRLSLLSRSTTAGDTTANPHPDKKTKKTLLSRRRRRSSARFLQLHDRHHEDEDDNNDHENHMTSGMADSSSLLLPFPSTQDLGLVYQNAIRMTAENKITASNSWNLNLIDHMDRFLGKPTTGSPGTLGTTTAPMTTMMMEDTLGPLTGVNFTKASCTLDASVKIYSYRVDDVHLTSYKVLANLNRTTTDQDHQDGGKKKEKGNSGPTTTTTTDGDEEEPAREQRRGGAKNNHDSTLETNLGTSSIGRRHCHTHLPTPTYFFIVHLP